MSSQFLVYKSSLDKSGGTCTSDSDLAIYLNAHIVKFNHRYRKNIGFFTSEELSGDSLKTMRDILYSELQDLVDNYHVDADPNGFGRSAMKVSILGQERILDHFRCKVDQIIESLNGLFEFIDGVVQNNSSVLVYGLGDLDTLDCNLLWRARILHEQNEGCSITDLQKDIGYIFHVDNLIKTNPNIFQERLQRLSKKAFLNLTGNQIELTEKGKVVEVWSNFISKSITIDREQLKTSVNTGFMQKWFRKKG